MKNNYKTQHGPDFVGIGAQRAGTSWLYNCLNEHPDVFMPQKEVHYFDKLASSKGIGWYDQLFAPKEMNQISGEFTPDYMFHQNTIAELHKYYPNTKLIIILRSPIERSYSAFQLFKAHGRFQNQSFNQALKAEPFLLEQSLYFEQLKNVFNYFNKEQVLIKLYDDISINPQGFYQSVCTFLELNNDYIPTSLNKIKNSSAMSSMQNKFNIPSIQKKIESSIFKETFKWFKTTTLANNIKIKLASKKPKDELKNLTEFSTKNIINKDLSNTQTLIDLNIEHWKI